MVAEEQYWRDQESARFDPEVELFQRYRAAEDSLTTKIFLYFGHEIPEIGGTGYDASSPERSFNIADLSDALGRMTKDCRKFDIVILSSCFGGTPFTIAAIAPYTRTIIASPDNLHLSYLDLHQFEYLGIRSRPTDLHTFAKNYSRQAFLSLTAKVQTAVTLAVYDVDLIQKYIDSVDSLYSHTLAELSGELPGSIEFYDCTENSAYILPGMSEGVYVYYRPARFGRTKNNPYHSGWECCRTTQ
ncbi:MAG: clostripain-related cysteine peptidase [Bacteroidota bacterium]